eukprot:CAMPEP_0172592862 /NCGR_PEP_ID=MMETSP1068-20121228/11993_1 /TAXON_ID=35684 /ORGANISM="Pseudopedinella elastica, Strain CCMP716" /LENGTH=53 /DNA_ID=CAMNT_0013390105 /DNA_START=294 /DNA_END=451 /DNA_ORIENTATION=-
MQISYSNSPRTVDKQLGAAAIAKNALSVPPPIRAAVARAPGLAFGGILAPAYR